MSSESIKEARDQLNLVLGFFSRVDSKASVVLAINTGMLAVLSSNAPPMPSITGLAAAMGAITIALLAGSFWFLYRVSSPVLSGGHDSLIYFREIARRTESKFIDQFMAQDESAKLKDILSQVWRNSEILKMKYDSLKRAFILMALSIIPWMSAVFLFAAYSGGSRSHFVK